MKIAVLYTCFNRKTKTLASLESVFYAVHYHNSHDFKNQIEIEVYLTDDGCTDGTPEAIRERFADKPIHILHSDGDLFWARGMCFAWNEALKRHSDWDYYLLMNDDTIANSMCFIELMKTHNYCVDKYSKEGIYSGITCSPQDPLVITYGGDVIPNKINRRQIRLGRSDRPQMVDVTNANILLVPKAVVDKIGIFYDGYQHSRADNDYAMMARRKRIPVLITASPCGECENDHGNPKDERAKIIGMTLTERKAYFKHPLHSSRDYLTMIRRNMPMRYPVSLIFSLLKLYCPQVYYRINGARGVN